MLLYSRVHYKGQLTWADNSVHNSHIPSSPIPGGSSSPGDTENTSPGAEHAESATVRPTASPANPEMSQILQETSSGCLTKNKTSVNEHNNNLKQIKQSEHTRKKNICTVYSYTRIEYIFLKKQKKNRCRKSYNPESTGASTFFSYKKYVSDLAFYFLWINKTHTGMIALTFPLIKLKVTHTSSTSFIHNSLRV